MKIFKDIEHMCEKKQFNQNERLVALNIAAPLNKRFDYLINLPLEVIK